MKCNIFIAWTAFSCSFLLAQNDVSFLLGGNQLLMQTTQEFRMDEGVIEEDAKAAADFWARQNAMEQAAKYIVLNAAKFSRPPSPEESGLCLDDLIRIKTEESNRIHKNNKRHLNRNLVFAISLPAMESRVNTLRTRPLLKHAYEIDKIRREEIFQQIVRMQRRDTSPSAESVQALFKNIIATDWLNRGLSNRDYSNRLEYFNQALALDADYKFARYQRSKTYFRLERFEEAVQDINRLLPTHENWLELYNLRGLALGNLKQYGEALADYNIVLESDPENTSALVNRGVALSHTGQTEAAIHDYQKALNLNADARIVHYNMACAYALQGDEEKALKELEKSLSKGYDNFEAIAQDEDLAGLSANEKFIQLLEKYQSVN